MTTQPSTPTLPESSRSVRPPTEASLGRRVFHTLVALAGWAIFAYWWTIVVHRVGRSEVRFTVLFILASFVICVTLTGLWVLHNRAIFRRKGARTAIREATLDYSHDPLGAAVTFEAPGPALLTAPIVRVLFEQDRKLFRPMRPDPPGKQTA